MNLNYSGDAECSFRPLYSDKALQVYKRSVTLSN